MTGDTPLDDLLPRPDAAVDDIAFLTGLPPDDLAAVRAHFEPISVAGGQNLFQEGEAADALYVVVSGAVGISLRDRFGRTRRLARIGPPETIGELAFLAEAPRSATATVLRDSRLLRLSREAFETLAAQAPGMMPYFAKLLARRMQRSSAGELSGARSGTFALIPVTGGVPAADLARKLASSMGPGTLVIDTWPEGADEAAFHAMEAGRQRVIYTAPDPDTPWARLCRRRADHVVLLARAGEVPLAADLGRLCPASAWTRHDLVVLQAPEAGLPLAPHPAVAELPINGLRLHLRLGAAPDLARLARLLTGRALGVVFSGGGARGFAHLGVLRALEEAGETVDLVGGTSIGAVFGAGVAMGWSLEEVQERVLDAFVATSPLNDYTWPLVALTRGAKVDSRLARHFGEANVEDLWRPFFCISTNLTVGEAMVHRSGALTTALRASIAIPGLLPPVVTSAGVLVDGAMMNNVPADVMADLERGRVLAVDVAGEAAFLGPSRRRWRTRLLRRLLGVPEATPGIAELLLRAATVSSDAQALLTRARATAVIRPPLADIDLRAWRSYRAVAEIGYQHTRRLIEVGVLEPTPRPPEP